MAQAEAKYYDRIDAESERQAETYALHTQEQFDEAASAAVRASIALGVVDGKRLVAVAEATVAAAYPFLEEIAKLKEDVEVWRGLLEDYVQQHDGDVVNAPGCTVVPKKEVVVDDVRLLCAAIADDEALSTDLVKPSTGPLRTLLVTEGQTVPGVHIDESWAVRLQTGK